MLGMRLVTPATRTANVSVLNDTGFPVVTFTNFSTTGTEGTRLVYPFTLSAASTGNISVSYTGNTGTSAIFGEDYTFSNLSSTRVQNNVDRGNIYIDLIADNLYEGVNENFAFTVTFTNAKFANDSNSITLTGTIRDGDSLPTITVSDSTHAEDVGEMPFEVELSAAFTTDYTIFYRTEEVVGSATPGTDYTAVTNTARTIRAGRN